MKPTAGVVHHTAVVVVSVQQDIARILFLKVVLLSRPNILPVDSDILIPVPKHHKLNSLILKFIFIQGDHSGCVKPPVDNITKVLFL